MGKIHVELYIGGKHTNLFYPKGEEQIMFTRLNRVLTADCMLIIGKDTPCDKYNKYCKVYLVE